jgi:transcriptional regulator with XRE-family HTH domain
VRAIIVVVYVHGGRGCSPFNPVEDLRPAFGRRVRTLREKRGISQEQLAESAQLHWTYVSGIERGVRNPGLNTLGRLARALGISLSKLLSNMK